MLLINLPTSHILRRSTLVELRSLYPELKTVNDLLTLNVSRDMPPRDLPVTGLLDALTPKHPQRNTRLKDLRTQYYDLRTKRWVTLRKGDSRGELTYNQLPDLQRYRFIWRARV